MGESVNPIEPLIEAWTKESPETEQGAIYHKCATELLSVIRPYLRQPGSPTEPGSYWIRSLNREDVYYRKVHQYEINDCALDFDVSTLPFADIEWHCKVMPPLSVGAE